MCMKVCDYTNNEMTLPNGNVVNYIDSTHVSIDGNDYHIAQLDEEDYYKDIVDYIHNYRVFLDRRWYRDWFNALLFDEIADVAHDVDEKFISENLVYARSFRFSNVAARKKWLRKLNMPSSMKNKMKRVISRYSTLDSECARMTIPNNMFDDMKISDKELTDLMSRYKISEIEYK